MTEKGHSGLLAGFDHAQADERIEKYQKIVDQAKADYEAKRDHLKQMRAERKDLPEPQPPGNGTRAEAEAIELRATGGRES